jgi:hypothetical protein
MSVAPTPAERPRVAGPMATGFVIVWHRGWCQAKSRIIGGTVLEQQQIDVLVAAAVAAPSMHNTQPWRFEINGGAIDVFIDRSRALPAEDPTGRAVRIAAGATVFNLRCAVAWLGLDSWYGLLPSPDDPDLVARLVVAPTDSPDRRLAQLYPQIARRHTSREPGRSGTLSSHVRVVLAKAAMSEGLDLTWLEADGPVDQLVAGIALERVLLTATREGVRASFLNQALEYDDTRTAVQQLTGKPGFAQMVIRFSNSPATVPTPRRPVAEVVRSGREADEVV